MWSAWFNPLSVYVGAELVLLEDEHGNSHIFHIPAGGSLEDALERVEHFLRDKDLQRWPWRPRVRLILGGALCSATFAVLPPKLRRWSEVSSIVQATAAAYVGAEPDQIVCALDSDADGFVASVTKHVYHSLLQWAARCKFAVVAIEPLWTAASQCALFQSTQKNAYLIWEPGAVTCIHRGEAALAWTLLLEHGATDTSHVRRSLVGAGLSEDRLVQIRLVSNAAAPLHHGPSMWSGYWREEGAL